MQYRMGDVIPLIQAEAAAQGIDPKIALGIFLSENTSDGVPKPDKMVSLTTQGINQETGKPSGALGLFQVVNTTLNNLRAQGKIPADLDYGTLSGQIKAGIAAVKDALVSTGGKDPYAAAALYLDGQKGLEAYKAGQPTSQSPAYFQRFAAAIGDSTSSFGRRFSVSGKLFDPEDLTKLRTYSDEAISTSQRARELLSAMGVKLDTATNELVSAVQKEGEAAVGAINAKASQEAYKASQAQSLFAAFGLQAQANKSLQEMALQDQLIEAAKPKIDQLLAVNPLANPIAYMLAQFQLRTAVPQYNTLVQDKIRAKQQLAERQALAEAQRSLTPQTTVDMVEKQRLADLDLTAAQAAQKVADAKVKYRGMQLQMIKEDVAYAMAPAEAQQALMRFNAQSYTAGEAAAGKIADTQKVGRINDVSELLGGPRFQDMAQVRGLNKEAQDQLEKLTMNPGPGAAIAFVTNFNTFPNLRAQGRSAFAAQAQQLADAAKEAYIADWKASPANAGKPVPPMTVPLLEEYGDRVYKRHREEVNSKNMFAVSKDNPYKMSPSQYAVAFKNPDENIFAKYVMESAAQKIELADKDVIRYAVSRVQNGENIDKVAAALVTFIGKGREAQWKTRGLSTLGYDPNTEGEAKTYRVNINDLYGLYNRWFGAASNITGMTPDLLNLSEAKNLLVRATAASYRNSAIDLSPAPPDFAPLATSVTSQ